MKKGIALLFIAIAGLSLASCTQADVQANEDKAKAILLAINNGARVAASVVKEGIDAVCANTGAVAVAGNVAGTIIGTQSGPNSTQNTIRLNASLNALNDVCNQAAANPNDPALKSLLRTAWVSYQAAKTAKANGG